MNTHTIMFLFGAYDLAYHAEAAEAYAELFACVTARPVPGKIVWIECIAPPRLTHVRAYSPLPPPGETRAPLDALLLAAAEASRQKLTQGTVILLTDGRDDASAASIGEAAAAIEYIKSRGIDFSYIGLSADAIQTAEQLNLQFSQKSNQIKLDK